MSPYRTESLGVDDHYSARIQRTVKQASMRAKASTGREAVSQAPGQKAGAVDPGAHLCLSGTCAAVLSSLSSF